MAHDEVPSDRRHALGAGSRRRDVADAPADEPAAFKTATFLPLHGLRACGRSVGPEFARRFRRAWPARSSGDP